MSSDQKGLRTLKDSVLALLSAYEKAWMLEAIDSINNATRPLPTCSTCAHWDIGHHYCDNPESIAESRFTDADDGCLKGYSRKVTP
jgi:hypothetical protein